MGMGQYVKKMKTYLPDNVDFVMASSQVAVFNNEGKFLITQRADDKRWDIPGGGCEEADSFKQTAVKEVKEELNIDTTEDDLEFLGVVSDASISTMSYPNSNKTRYYTTVFKIDDFTGNIEFTDGENLDYAFVTAQEALDNYNLIPSSRYIIEQLKNNNIPFVN